MPRTRVSLNSKAHQLGCLKTKKIFLNSSRLISTNKLQQLKNLATKGGQEVDRNFFKFIIYPLTMIALLTFSRWQAAKHFLTIILEIYFNSEIDVPVE